MGFARDGQGAAPQEDGFRLFGRDGPERQIGRRRARRLASITAVLASGQILGLAKTDGPALGHQDGQRAVRFLAEDPPFEREKAPLGD